MTDELLRKESLRIGQALPVYLGVQGFTLLFTYLDFQVYMDTLSCEPQPDRHRLVGGLVYPAHLWIIHRADPAGRQRLANRAG